MAFVFAEKNKEQDVSQGLLDSIKEIKKRIAENESLFNLSTSTDLIDYAIHEDIALRAKFNYLIKRYKQEEENQQKEKAIQVDENSNNEQNFENQNDLNEEESLQKG